MSETEQVEETQEVDPRLTLTINGREVKADPGELVIDVAERHGVYIPRFCYHNRMTPVGMCRMCVVEIDTGRGPALTPSCMIACGEGMTVDTESQVTKKAQEGILEFLLINHPLDCPVCDKGGECPLQDQAVACGPGESRFVEEKRHYEKPIPLNENVALDRERCILCDRCTRFAKEVAGDPLIHFVERGNQTQVLTFPEEPFASYFSGNTVQLCPVGALTAKPYRFKARPWDLEEAESTCTDCSVGCRISIQTSRNDVLRLQGVDSDAVNHGWLCDKGRFGFEQINSDSRLRTPQVLGDSTLAEASWHDALDKAAKGLRLANNVAVLGGARLTNEDAFAWAKLASEVIDTSDLDAQLGDGLGADLLAGVPRATIDEACDADSVLLIGADLKEELPVLYLRLKGAVAEGRTQVIEIAATDMAMTDYTKVSLRYTPGELRPVLDSVLSGKAVEGLDASQVSVAHEALGSGSLVVLVGRSSLAEHGAIAALAVESIRSSKPDATFLPLSRRGNVNGALDMGLAPTNGGRDATAILKAAAAGEIDALVLLGSDPLADFPDRDLAEQAFSKLGFILSLDRFMNSSNERANVVLPVAGFGERDGTFTNLEGRVTRVVQRVTAPGTARYDWMIAAELAWRLDGDLGLTSVAGITEAISESIEKYADVTKAALDDIDGVVVRGTNSSFAVAELEAAPKRDAYSLRLVINRRLYGNGTGVTHSQSSTSLAPGAVVKLHPSEFDRLGVAEDQKIQVISSLGSVSVTTAPDASVPRGVAVLAGNQANVRAFDLVSVDSRLLEIRMETK